MTKISQEIMDNLREFLSRGCEYSGTQDIVYSIAYEALEAAGCELCGSEETAIVDWNGKEICTVDKFTNIFWDKAVEKILNVLETEECEPRISQDIYDKIETIADHYSKREQWLQALEEVKELKDELDGAGNPFKSEDMVKLPGNTWSECADVFIMIIQLTIQHNKEKEFWQQVEFKLNRQLKRMKEEEKQNGNTKNY